MKAVAPIVSVIMPVYNAGNYLHSAIESILQQSYSDFELIIINDGSTDESESVIKRFTDPRIHHYSQTNQGLTATLNRLISLSRGQYLARMDQDDISVPNRLATQVSYLNEHPEVALVGSWVEVIGPTNEHLGINRYPISDPAIKELMLIKNPFAHGSVMMRRSSNLVYRKEFDYAEDYGLWSELAKDHNLVNIPAILYRWRTTPGGMTTKYSIKQIEVRQRIHNHYHEFYFHRYTIPSMARSDRTEIEYRGKLRVIYSKMIYIRLYFRKSYFRLVIKRLKDLVRVIFSWPKVGITNPAVPRIP